MDKTLKEMRKMSDIAYGGALALDAVDTMKNPGLASSKIEGSIGIGMMGATSNAMFDLIEGKRKRR